MCNKTESPLRGNLIIDGDSSREFQLPILVALTPKLKYRISIVVEYADAVVGAIGDIDILRALMNGYELWMMQLSNTRAHRTKLPHELSFCIEHLDTMIVLNLDFFCCKTKTINLCDRRASFLYAFYYSF